MKIRGEIDYMDFLTRVKECRGEVIFKSDEGDVLNLKSVLSQYVFAAVMSNGDLINRGEIVCEDEADYTVLSDFLINCN